MTKFGGQYPRGNLAVIAVAALAGAIKAVKGDYRSVTFG
jgi:hypothetical protein